MCARPGLFRLVLVGALFFSQTAFAQLVVSDATIRILPPGVPNTAAYFVIENTGDSDQYLVSARSEAAETVELHAHVMEGEMMRMVKQSEVLVAAGQKVHFEPGGLHVMLFGLTSKIQQDTPVSLVLTTKQGQEVVLQAQPVMPGEEKAHKHHH